MQISPKPDEALQIARSGSYGVIPVAAEIFADLITPVEALKALKQASDHVYMLESAEDSKRWGRYTFLGYDPKVEITLSKSIRSISLKCSSSLESRISEGSLYLMKS